MEEADNVHTAKSIFFLRISELRIHGSLQFIQLPTINTGILLLPSDHKIIPVLEVLSKEVLTNPLSWRQPQPATRLGLQQLGARGIFQAQQGENYEDRKALRQEV